MFLFLECGQSKYEDAGQNGRWTDEYIVGGVEARRHEFPWQVLTVTLALYVDALKMLVVMRS